MPEIKVVQYVEDLKIGGIEKIISYIALGLRNEYDIEVWCIVKRGQIAEELEDAGISIREVRNIFELLKEINRTKPDIIHMHGISARMWGRAVGLLFPRIKKIIHIHTLFDKHLNKWNLFKESVLGKFTNRVIAGCRAVKNAYMDSTGVPGDKVEVVYNSSPEFPAYDNKEIVKLKQDLGINDEIIICFWGRLVKIKGVQYLLRAGKYLKNENIKILIIGDGPYKSDLEDIICKEGINEKVVFTGMRNDIDKLSCLVDIYVQPSILRESVPLSLSEAASRGIPLIATDIGGNSEIVIDGVNGYLVHPEDENIIAEKIRILIKDANRRKQMGDEARKIYENKFALKIMLDGIKAIYNGIYKI
ncbi:glycosyltransferase [Elusimicrobiota bacterium]